MSGSLDRKPYSSRQVKGHNSDGVVSVKYENVTPVGHHSQQQGSSTFRGGGSLDRKPHGSRQVKGHNSDGVVSQDNDNGTSASRQNQQRGSSSFGGESFGGREKQWRTSSKASSTAGNSSHDKQLGSTFVEEKVPINLGCSFMGSVDHLTGVSCLSLESAAENRNFSGANIVTSTENELDHEKNEHPNSSTVVEVFDICPLKSGYVALKPSLIVMNREKRNEKKNYQGIILRSGMVHLKSYFSTSQQVPIFSGFHF